MSAYVIFNCFAVTDVFYREIQFKRLNNGTTIDMYQDK